MSEFKLTEDKLPTIASELKVDKAKLDEFLPVFEEFYETVRLQHLASIMRALELHIREKHGKPSFRIEWKAMPKGETTTKDGVGLSWPNRYGIAISPELDLRQLRVHVAHELGHLFYATEHPENIRDGQENQNMANVFGVFTMLGRNEFYKEKAPTMCHATWTQVINDFKQLGNREQGKFNTSG
ncbi:hypothetical protein FACS1894190_02540 [Spirochaetia bacterium]|nr:hypothetical protein FACS1894190_02540 [Spirochaetia bacterium]